MTSRTLPYDNAQRSTTDVTKHFGRWIAILTDTGPPYIKYFSQMTNNSYGTFTVRTIAATYFYHTNLHLSVSISAVAAPLIEYLWPPNGR